MNKILIDEATVKLVLEALEELTDTEQTYEALERGDAAITALREALAKQPAPVAPVQKELVEKIISNLEPLLSKKNQSWAYAENALIELLAATPQAQPAREPLTLDQIGSIIEACEKNVKGEFLVEFARAIEAATKENT